MALIQPKQQKLRFAPLDDVASLTSLSKEFKDLSLAKTDFTPDAKREIKALLVKVALQEANLIDLKQVVESQKVELKEMREELDVTEKRLVKAEKSATEYANAFKLVYDNVKLLKDVALNYRPAVIVIAIRGELDGGRFILANGFMTVFPRFFPSKYLVEKFDPEAVRWYRFQVKLDEFFDVHFKKGVQETSIFHTAMEHYDAIVPPRKGNPLEDFVAPNLDDFEYSEPDFVQDRGEGRDDAYWLTRLAFVAPALIWAYLELKKAMYTDMDELASCMNSANIFQGLIDGLTGDDSGLPYAGNLSRIDIPLTLRPGTGLDVRANPNWKDVFVSPGYDNTLQYELYELLSAAPYASGRRPRAMSVDQVARSNDKTDDVEKEAGRKRALSNSENTANEEGSRAQKMRMDSSSRSNIYADLQTSLLAPETGAVVKEQEGNQVEAHSLGSYRRSLKELNAEVESIENHLTGVRQKFLAVLKCLTVLLDPELVGVAILGSSYARNLLNRKIHPPLDYDSEITKDALGCFQEIKDTEGTLEPEEGKENFDYRKEQAKLKKVIRGSDHLLMTSRGEVEEAIDRFLVQHVATKPTYDLKVLIEYCNDVSPIRR